MDKTYNIQEILHLLPHRYPFILIDRILDLVPDEKVVALKNVTINEPFFQGHFPGTPIMPGVLIIEAMAQAGAVLAAISLLFVPPLHLPGVRRFRAGYWFEARVRPSCLLFHWGSGEWFLIKQNNPVS